MPLTKSMVALGLLVLISIAVSACGSSVTGSASTASDSRSHVLSAAETKHLLLQLPYRYHWRQVELPEGASVAVAGTAFGKHRTIVHFGISLGAEPQAVPVPRAGTLTPDYDWGNGFVFNDDLVLPKGVGRQFHTKAQWEEAINMVFEMEQKLCRAISGKPCPV